MRYIKLPIYYFETDSEGIAEYSKADLFNVKDIKDIYIDREMILGYCKNPNMKDCTDVHLGSLDVSYVVGMSIEKFSALLNEDLSAKIDSLIYEIEELDKEQRDIVHSKILNKLNEALEWVGEKE